MSVVCQGEPALRRSSTSRWSDVDGSIDPGAFVGYLDAVSGQEAVRAYKRQSYALLALRPGDRVLDVGCGAGDDARALAELVAPGGSVLGLDASSAMVDEARRRSASLGHAIDFRAGDAHRLELPDESFDAARADRVFQHLDGPEQALAELVRVTRRGGRIVVVDPDWATVTVDGSDRETTRAVLAEVAAAHRNPWMGRRLYGLFRRAGLAEVSVIAGVAVLTDLALADRLFRLAEAANRARAAGTVTEDAAADWLRGLEAASAAGEFFSSLTAFIVAGRRP